MSDQDLNPDALRQEVATLRTRLAATQRLETDAARMEEELRLLVKLSLAIAGADDVQAALAAGLRLICSATNWQLGQVWLPDAEGRSLQCAPAWFGGPGEFDRFRAWCHGRRCAPGEGIAGRAWATQQPVWVPDLGREPALPETPPAAAAGLVSAFAIPIQSGPDVLGVLEFFATARRERDPYFLDLVLGMAAQLGLLLRRRQAEEASRQSEERYRGVVEGSIQGILIHQDSIIHFANPALARIYGYDSPAELIGVNQEVLIAPEERPVMQARRDACLRGELLPVYHGWRGLRRDGSRIWVQSSASAITWNHRPAVLSFHVDVSDLKQAEEGLGASEARYRTLVENLTQCIFLKDRDLRFVAVNRPFCELLGRSESEVLGKNDFDFFPPELAEKYRADDGRVLDRRERVEVEEQNLVAGKLRTVRVVKTPVLDRWGRVAGVLGIFWDVTDQRRLEGQLLHAQKMEAIGRLAGGVAHDFNNLLTIINGYGDLLLGTLRRDDVCWEQVEQIRRAGERAAELTRQLLAFSRQQVTRPRVLDLNATVTGVEKMLRRLIGEDVELVTRLAFDLPPVCIDPGQVEQVLMNLAVNARDAMPGGGRLLLETRPTRLEPAYALAHPEVEPGPYVAIVVNDTGHGMSEEVKARMFEPFFTTKEFGKGTGLGLATVYGIVKQAGGHIEVESEPGKGSTFTVYLPQAADAAAADDDASHASAGSVQGSETVLLVEDEPMLRSMARRILAVNGYTVLEAGDGPEALRLSHGHDGPIDVLLTDVVMPGMSGPELARELAALRPDLKVLYMSGYTDGALSSHGVPLQECRFLQKPFTPTSLVRKLRTVLDEP